MTALVICFQPNPHLELGDFPGLCTFHFTFPWSLSRFRIYKDIRSIRQCPPSFIEDLDKSLKNMETSQEHAPLASGSLSGSSEALVPTETTRGVSNKRAFKIAGLTTLACLLLASQVFTAYLVFNQNKQIDSLQSNGENMRKELKNTRSQTVPAVQMRMPMHSMPLFMDFTEDEAVADTEPMTNLEQVKDLLQNSQLPQFNETFLANLQSLKEQMEESEWKGFESWMRHWLIFQMAQQAPAPPTQKAPLLQTKCQVEAAVQTPRKLGVYKPQCDELGNYLPMQCHPSTGYCWCVDASGSKIAGSSIRGRPDCNRAARHMMAFPKRMQLKAFSDGALLSDE